MHVVIISRTYAAPDARAKLRALSSLGASLTVLVPHRAEHTVASSHSAGTIRILPIELKGDAPDEYRWSRSAVRSALSSTGAELLQIEEEPHTPLGALPAREAKRIGVPYVVVTARARMEELSWSERRRRRTILRNAIAWHASSAAAAADLARLDPDKPLIASPQLGVEVPGAKADPTGAFVLGFNARLIPERGLAVLLEAATGLAGAWQLLVSGTGPEQPALEALAQRLGISGRIQWLGALPRADQDALRYRFACFVSAGQLDAAGSDLSRSAILAAMAAGVPIVATEQPAVAALLDGAGLLAPPDDPVALRALLQRLLDSPDERAELGTAAREQVQRRYSVDSVARMTFELWSQLLAAV